MSGGGGVQRGDEERATYLDGNFLNKYIYVYFSYVPRMSRGVIGVFTSSPSTEGEQGEEEEEGTIILLNSASTTRASRAESEKTMNVSMKRHAASMGITYRKTPSFLHASSAEGAFSILQTTLENLHSKLGFFYFLFCFFFLE